MPVSQRLIEEFIIAQREKGVGLSSQDGDLFRTPAVNRLGKFYHLSYRIIDGKVSEPELMVQSSLSARPVAVTENAETIARQLIIRNYQPILNLVGAAESTVDRAKKSRGKAETVLVAIGNAFLGFMGSEPISEVRQATQRSTLSMLAAFERMSENLDPSNQRGLLEKPQSLFSSGLYTKLPIVEVGGLKLRTRLGTKKSGVRDFSLSPAGGSDPINLFDPITGEVRAEFDTKDAHLKSKFANPQEFLQAYTKAFLEMVERTVTQNLPPEIVRTTEVAKPIAAVATVEAAAAVSAPTPTATTLLTPFLLAQARARVNLATRVGSSNSYNLPNVTSKDGSIYHASYTLDEAGKITSARVVVQTTPTSPAIELKGEELARAVVEISESYTKQITKLSGIIVRVEETPVSRSGTLDMLVGFKEMAQELNPSLVEQPRNLMSRFGASYDKLPVVTVGTINLRPRLKYERDGTQKTFSLAIEGQGEGQAFTLFDTAGNVLPRFTDKDRALIPAGIATPQELLERFQTAYKAMTKEAAMGENLPVVEVERAEERVATTRRDKTREERKLHPAVVVAREESQLAEERRQLDEERLLLSIDASPERVTDLMRPKVEAAQQDAASFTIPAIAGLPASAQEIQDLTSYKSAFDFHLKQIRALENAVKTALEQTEVLPGDDTGKRIAAMVEAVQENEEKLTALRTSYLENYDQNPFSIARTSGITSYITRSAESAKIYQIELLKSIGEFPGGRTRVLSKFLSQRPTVFEPYATHEDPGMFDAAYGLKNFLSDPGNEAEKAEFLSALTTALQRVEAINRAKAVTTTEVHGEEIPKLDFASFTASKAESDSIEKVQADLALAMEKCLSPRLRRNKEATATVATMLCELTPKFYVPVGPEGAKEYPATAVVGMVDMLSKERRQQTVLTARLRHEEAVKDRTDLRGLYYHSDLLDTARPKTTSELREEYFKSLREAATKDFEPLTTSTFSQHGIEILPHSKRYLETDATLFTKVLTKLKLEEKAQSVALVEEYANQLQDLTRIALEHHEAIVEKRPVTPLAEMPQEELNVTRKSLEPFRADKVLGPIIAELEAHEEKLRKTYEHGRRFDALSRTAAQGIEGYRKREAALIAKVSDSVEDKKTPSTFGSFSLRTGKIFAAMGRGIGAVDSRLGIPFLSSGCASAAGFFFRQAEAVGKAVGNREMVRDALTSSFANEGDNLVRISRSPFARIRAYLAPKPPVVEVKREISVSTETAQRITAERAQERQDAVERELDSITLESSSTKEAVLTRVTEMLESAKAGGIKLDDIAPHSASRDAEGYRTFLKSANPSFFLRIKEEDGRVSDVKLFRKTGSQSKEIDLFDKDGNVVADFRSTFEELLTEYESHIKAETARLAGRTTATIEAEEKAAADAAKIASIQSEASSTVTTFIEETPNLRTAREGIDEDIVTLKTLRIGRDSYALSYNASNPDEFTFIRNGRKVEITNQEAVTALNNYLIATRAEIIRSEVVEETQSELLSRTTKLLNDARRFGVVDDILKDSERFEGYKNFAKDVKDSPYYMRIHFDSRGNIDEIKLFEKGRTALFGYTTQATQIPTIDASGKLTPQCELAFAAAERLLAPSKTIAERKEISAASMVETFIAANRDDMAELSIDHTYGALRITRTLELDSGRYFLQFDPENPKNFELRRKDPGARKGVAVDMTNDTNIAILKKFLDQLNKEITEEKSPAAIARREEQARAEEERATAAAESKRKADAMFNEQLASIVKIRELDKVIKRVQPSFKSAVDAGIEDLTSTVSQVDGDYRDLMRDSDSSHHFIFKVGKTGRISDLKLVQKTADGKEEIVEMFDENGRLTTETAATVTRIISQYREFIERESAPSAKAARIAAREAEATAKAIEEAAEAERIATEVRAEAEAERIAAAARAAADAEKAAAAAVLEAKNRNISEATSALDDFIDESDLEFKTVKDPLEGRNKMLPRIEIDGEKYFVAFEEANSSNFALVKVGKTGTANETVDLNSDAGIAIFRNYMIEAQKENEYSRLASSVQRALKAGETAGLADITSPFSEEGYEVLIMESDPTHFITFNRNSKGNPADIRLMQKNPDGSAIEVEMFDASGRMTEEAKEISTRLFVGYHEFIAAKQREAETAKEESHATHDAAAEVADEVTAAIGSVRTRLSKFSSTATERDTRRDSVGTAASAESQDIDEVVVLDRKGLMTQLQEKLEEMRKVDGARVEDAGRAGGQKITLPAIALEAEKGAGPVHPSYFVIVTNESGQVTNVELHGGDPKSSWRFGADHERELFDKDKIKAKHEKGVAVMLDAYGKMIDAQQKAAEEESHTTTTSFLGFDVDAARRDSFSDLDDLPRLGRNPFLVEKKAPAAEERPAEAERDEDLREDVPSTSVTATAAVHLSDAQAITRTDDDKPALSMRRKRSKFADRTNESGGSGITAGGRE